MFSKQEFIEIVNKLLLIKILDSQTRRCLELIIFAEKDLPEQIFLATIIEKLSLIDLSKITDEEGHFIQITEVSNDNNSIIIYALNEEQISCLHRLQVNETWEWLGGNPISIYTFSESGIKEITLNKDNPLYIIEKGTLFGAKNILSSSNTSQYSLVTCTCEPSFKIEHYIRPTLDELKKFKKKYFEYRLIIDELTPKPLINNRIRSFVQMFTCCIGIKKNEDEINDPLINSLQNNR